MMFTGMRTRTEIEMSNRNLLASCMKATACKPGAKEHVTVPEG
jgi:hypothetical protein